jgi:3'-5' exoribonuclease 1
MHYIVFDLEATCWPPDTPGVTQEIIEIGAYRLDRSGQRLGHFHRMVRPVRHPYLSPYCLQLTGITQEEVDRAQRFPDAAIDFLNWLEAPEVEFILVSWGARDRFFLEQDCRLHDVETDWLESGYYDLKQIYKEMFRIPNRLGLNAALRREGLTFEGNPHRALDDAYNLAGLVARHIDIWPIP